MSSTQSNNFDTETYFFEETQLCLIEHSHFERLKIRGSAILNFITFQALQLGNVWSGGQYENVLSYQKATAIKKQVV